MEIALRGRDDGRSTETVLLALGAWKPAKDTGFHIPTATVTAAVKSNKLLNPRKSHDFPDSCAETIFLRLLQTQRFSFAPGNGEFLVLSALLHVTTSSGELAEKELLGHVCANSFRDADREISEHQPSTTIGSRIVKVRETG